MLVRQVDVGGMSEAGSIDGEERFGGARTSRRSSTRTIGNGSTASVWWKRLGDGFRSFRVARTTLEVDFGKPCDRPSN